MFVSNFSLLGDMFFGSTLPAGRTKNMRMSIQVFEVQCEPRHRFLPM